MANYYTDHPEFEFYLNHPEMKRIVELKERGFADKAQYADAPVDFDDAIENYKKLLEITGDIAANILEPNAEDVDLEGPHLVDGRMVYASKTFENLDATRKAGLWGVSMPRRYGGLNMPITPYSMASEIVAAADAGFQNIWSLQDCIETLYEFGSEEQRQKYIPRVCAGETMSMDLTEPDAGSDLQRVMLKASYDEENKCWVKHLKSELHPLVYIYLVQIVLHNNDGRVVGTSGDAAVSAFASSTSVNTGHTGYTPCIVYYGTRMKKGLSTAEGETVDVIGGKLTTFGLCDMDPYWTDGRAEYSGSRSDLQNYLYFTLRFSNETSKTMLLPVTDQCQRQSHGGVITVHVDCRNIDLPDPGDPGSGNLFVPTIEDYTDVNYDIPM